MAQPNFCLKRAVGVSPDPGREDYQPGQLRVLDAGTALDDIPRSEVEQLAPAHFVDADFDEDTGQLHQRSDEVPDDWRTNPDTLAHDRRQAKNIAAERKARDKERAARRAEKAKARED